MANTEDYPSRWSTVHLGLRADDLDTDPYVPFRDAALARGWKVFVDGDGWQSWGELPRTDANDDDTMHVQVAVPTKAEAADAVTALRGSRLPFVPIVDTDSHAVATIVVSAAEDWSQQTYRETFA